MPPLRSAPRFLLCRSRWSLPLRALATALAAMMLGGCFHYVERPPSELPQAKVDSARARVTTAEGVIELDEAKLEYPMLHGSVRSARVAGATPAVGSALSLDVRRAQRVEIRRLNGAATTLIIVGSVVATVGTVILVVFALSAGTGFIPN